MGEQPPWCAFHPHMFGRRMPSTGAAHPPGLHFLNSIRYGTIRVVWQEGPSESLLGTRPWTRAASGPSGPSGRPDQSDPRPDSGRQGFEDMTDHLLLHIPSRVMLGASATMPRLVCNYMVLDMDYDYGYIIATDMSTYNVLDSGHGHSYVHRDSTEPLDSLPIGMHTTSRSMDSDIQ